MRQERNLGRLWFQQSHIFIFERSQLNEFLTDLQDFSLENYFRTLGKGSFSHEPVHVVIIFQCLTKRQTIFTRHPV